MTDPANSPYVREALRGVHDRVARVEELKARLLTGEIDGRANPYLDAVVEMGGPWSYRGFTEDKFDSEMTAVYAREAFVHWFSWAVPTEEALELVAGGGEVVEVGAGGGYWAALLRARGVTVHAYDRAPDPAENIQVDRSWTDVVRAGVRAGARHPAATLLLCWPPYDSRMAALTVEHYRRAGGRRVAYIGEHGGCTGESPLLDQLEPAAEAGIPQWPGIHDFLRIYELP